MVGTLQTCCLVIGGLARVRDVIAGASGTDMARSAIDARRPT